MVNVYYQNTRGLNTKVADIYVGTTFLSEYDIFCFTETWLSSNVKSSELFDLNHFNVFRSDRSLSGESSVRGGGVLLAVRNKFRAKQIDLFSVCGGVRHLAWIDVLVVECSITVNSCVHFIVVYVPPKCSSDDFAFFVDTLMSLHCVYDSKKVIIGDFNIPGFGEEVSDSCNRGRLLNNLSDFFDLKQYNLVRNKDDRMLDLVFGNLKIEVSPCVDALTPEDHYHPSLDITVFIENLKQKPHKSSNQYMAFNFKKANFVGLYRELTVANFAFLNNVDDVDVAVSLLDDMLRDIFIRYVPLKRKSLGNYPVWYDRQIITSIRRKHRLWVRYRKTKCRYDYDQFSALRKHIKIQTRNAYDAYLGRVSSDVRKDPKKFWGFFKVKNNIRSFPSVVVRDGIILNDPQAIVDAYADFFVQAFVSSDPNTGSNSDPICVSTNAKYLNILGVDENIVLSAIRRLKSTMTAGPDLVPSFLIKDCGAVLAKPLTYIFNLILKSSIFPVAWKMSHVTPVFKSGDRSDVTNYRPISLICNFSKVFEHVLHSLVYPHVSHMIIDSQHGFMKGRSTVTNLAVISQYLCEIVDRKGQVDCIYTDFSKAFDRMNHSILLEKLESFGFSENLVNLMYSYLSGRRQCVLVNGFRSRAYGQSSGVPQGSVLGPLLFNLYVNDITVGIHSHCLLYADDLKIYRQIRSSVDCEQLQADLTTLCNWCNRHLPLNFKKCCVMSYARKLKPLTFDYSLDQGVLQRPDHVRDLGVTFEAHLTFNEHTHNVLSAATDRWVL
jgi:hypothetical protein